jgi:hypothetical protein
VVPAPALAVTEPVCELYQAAIVELSVQVTAPLVGSAANVCVFEEVAVMDIACPQTLTVKKNMSTVSANELNLGKPFSFKESRE